MKLGRLPARRDARTFRLSDHFPVGQISAPPMLRDYSAQADQNWQQYANLSLSTCVPASFAHLIQAWTACNGSEIEASEDDVVGAYKAISGYDGTPTTDTGCAMLDAMRFWKSTGIGGHKILAYVSIDPQNRLEVEAAINLFGGITVGADMPIACRGNLAAWDIAPANHWSPDYRPNSWGGHAMACVGYSHSLLTLVTWGKLQVATRSWGTTYISEAYAAISEDWVTRTRDAPNGFNLDSLFAALTALSA